MESLEWTGKAPANPIEPPWQYSIIEEGHLFRFTGKYEYYDDKGERRTIVSDFGLVPGGAYVAIVDAVIAARTKVED